MKIEVGDRVTYKDGYVGIVLDNEEINYQTVVRDREIIKVERIGQNGWEVVEEKKELLTEEEREFLKQTLRFGNYGKDTGNGEILFIQKYGYFLRFYYDEWACNTIYFDKMECFKMLEEEKKYTLKELRIGGINNGFR